MSIHREHILWRIHSMENLCGFGFQQMRPGGLRLQRNGACPSIYCSVQNNVLSIVLYRLQRNGACPSIYCSVENNVLSIVLYRLQRNGACPSIYCSVQNNIRSIVLYRTIQGMVPVIPYRTRSLECDTFCREHILQTTDNALGRRIQRNSAVVKCWQ